MARKFYPVGIQTFEKLREENKLYIDKTEYVYNLTHQNSSYVFLSRPRRFGKSLLVSTLKSYFEGKKELFKGLAIENLETEWTEYPVLHFDMSKGKHMNEAQLEEFLGYRLEDYEKKYGLLDHRNGNNNRFCDLIEFVFHKTGKQVVVLVDEYDAPLLDVVHEEESMSVLRNIMRNFYSPLKACDPYLRFVFLTGITKFSQLSIFSELNNIANVSMNKKYAGICGITKEELLTQMSDDIDDLAEELSLTREEAIQKLTDNYDGYHFTWPSPDVFNPFSLLNCFSDGNIDSYWFGSGTPTYLIEKMRQFNTIPSNIDNCYAVKSDFDAPTETMRSIIPLLYQSGYVTIKDYDDESELYLLGIPNKEIRVGLYQSLLPSYINITTNDDTVTISQMSVLIRRGDMDGALTLLQTFLATIPYCNNTLYEGHFQQMLYIVFALLTNLRINVEQHTQKGRTDITLETASHIYIMELKFNGSAEEAMAQINSKRYADAFKMSGKEIVKVGMNFDVENERNITKWIIE